MTELSEKLLHILKIDSLTGQEQEITDWIKNFAAKLSNFELTQDGKVLIFKKHNEGKPVVAIYGHTDTVPNQQEKSPYKNDELIFGCGASDMKGGLAVMLHLMEYFNQQNSKYSLKFIYYNAEEGPYKKSGLYGIFDRVRDLAKSDLALILEPTINTIQTGCLGSVNANIKFIGKSGHSARPWQAKNAIYEALPLLNKIAGEKTKQVEVDGYNFPVSISVTILNSGKTRNVIPGEAQMNINYRFSPDATEQQAIDFITEYIGKNAVIVDLDSAPAARIVKNNQLLNELSHRFSLKTEVKQAWTDIARLYANNIDAVNFGPGDPALAHQKNEYIKISDLMLNYAILKEYLS